MTTKTLAIIAIGSLTLHACKREKDEPIPPAATTGTVALKFTLMHGTDPFSLNTNYVDGAGNTFQFSKVKFYASDIHLTDHHDAVLAEFHDTYLLVDASAANNEFTLGSMAPAEIHEAHITLGLEPVVNASDPMTAEAPLNDPDMMWAWSTSAGRMFLKLEGRVDGNADGDVEDEQDIPFFYHCLNNPDLLRETHAHLHAEVVAGGTARMNAKVDMAVVVSGLDFLTNPAAMDGGVDCMEAMDSLAVSIDEL
ncbi:MAG TPA: hypothetical protein PLB89_03455 [Flavobacteriales bacterium]|nr:hypothetical protein [Flavobacteriales bacterium]